MTTRLENLLGALGVAINDRMDDAFDEACAVGDSAPAALILVRENPDTRIGMFAAVRIEVHAKAPFRPDLVDELAVPAAQVQHGGPGGDPLREKFAHQNAPDRIAVVAQPGESPLIEFLQLGR